MPLNVRQCEAVPNTQGPELKESAGTGDRPRSTVKQIRSSARLDRHPLYRRKLIMGIRRVRADTDLHGRKREEDKPLLARAHRH